MKTIQPSRHCSHDITQLVRRIINGSENFGIQCDRCGNYLALKKATLTEQERQTAGEYNEQIKNEFWTWQLEQKSQEHQKQLSEKNAEWWAQYNEYLNSPKWKSKRQRVLSRDNGLCQACLIRPATQVHHLTYDHVFDEPLFDLISICDLCHNALHQKKETA